MPEHTYDYDVADQSARDVERVSYPLIFWKNGDSKMKKLGGFAYTGGFFFADTEIEKAGVQTGTLGDTWIKESFQGDKSEEVTGLYANRAAIALVRTRSRWVKKGERVEVLPITAKYEPGFRMQMQAAGFVKGHPGLLTFSFKGYAVSGLKNEWNGIKPTIQSHINRIVSIANAKAPEGKKLPPYAFWLKVQAGPHVTVGKPGNSSDATLPILYLPKEVTEEYVHGCYVGRENLIAFQKAYHDLEDWAKEWDGAGNQSGYPNLNSDEDPQQNREKAKAALAGGGGASEDPFGDDLSGVTDDEVPF